jgi:hypothetical protein
MSRCTQSLERVLTICVRFAPPWSDYFDEYPLLVSHPIHFLDNSFALSSSTNSEQACPRASDFREIRSW